MFLGYLRGHQVQSQQSNVGAHAHRTEPPHHTAKLLLDIYLRKGKPKVRPHSAYFAIVTVVLPACSFLLFWYQSWLTIVAGLCVLSWRLGFGLYTFRGPIGQRLVGKVKR